MEEEEAVEEAVEEAAVEEGLKQMNHRIQMQQEEDGVEVLGLNHTIQEEEGGEEGGLKQMNHRIQMQQEEEAASVGFEIRVSTLMMMSRMTTNEKNEGVLREFET
jgi:hypothetical protein